MHCFLLLVRILIFHVGTHNLSNNIRTIIRGGEILNISSRDQKNKAFVSMVSTENMINKWLITVVPYAADCWYWYVPRYGVLW